MTAASASKANTKHVIGFRRPCYSSVRQMAAIRQRSGYRARDRVARVSLRFPTTSSSMKLSVSRITGLSTGRWCKNGMATAGDNVSEFGPVWTQGFRKAE